MSSEVAQTPTLPLNKEGILQSSSTSRSSRFHMYIYTISIISIHTEGCLHDLCPSRGVFMNQFYQDVWEKIFCYLSISTVDGKLPYLAWGSWTSQCVWPSTTCSSHLLMGYSHTWLRTWMSRGTCAIVRPSATCPTNLPRGFLPYLAQYMDE